MTCSKDRSFICWDLSQQKKVSCHRQNMGNINDIILNDNQDIIITCNSDKSIKYFDLRQNVPINIIKNAHNGNINKIRLSNNDNNVLASIGDDKTIKLWDFNLLNCILFFSQI